MQKIAVTNPTAMPIYVGATMIPAGETRHFDAADVPPHLRPAPEAAAPVVPDADPLAEILGHSVPAIKEMLPALDDATLEALGDAEQARGDEARKTLLAALAEEQLKRADAKAGDEGSQG